jgi:hypothetical protein
MAAMAGPSGVSAACWCEMRRLRAGGTATEGGQEAAKMRRRVKKLSCAACRRAVPDVLETPSRWGASMHAALVYSCKRELWRNGQPRFADATLWSCASFCSDVVSILPLIFCGDRSPSHTQCRLSDQQHELPRSSGQRASPGLCGDMLQHPSMSTSWCRRPSLVLDLVGSLPIAQTWLRNCNISTDMLQSNSIVPKPSTPSAHPSSSSSTKPCASSRPTSPSAPSC